MKNYISPSLLNIDEKKRAKVAQTLINNGIKWIHYDVMDGVFVPDKAITLKNYLDIKNNTKEHISDIHLMVNDVEHYIEQYLGKAKYITFHYEALSIKEIHYIIDKYQNLTALGIAIKPETNVEQIYEFLDYIDLVLIMSVEPGRGGQDFISNSLGKIKKLRKYIDIHHKKIIIQIDGGINDKTANKSLKAGANVLVSGSYLVEKPTKEQIQTLLRK